MTKQEHGYILYGAHSYDPLNAEVPVLCMPAHIGRERERPHAHKAMALADCE